MKSLAKVKMQIPGCCWRKTPRNSSATEQREKKSGGKNKRSFLFSLFKRSWYRILLESLPRCFRQPSRMSTFPLDFFSNFNLFIAAIVTPISLPARDNSVAVHFLFLHKKTNKQNKLATGKCRRRSATAFKLVPLLLVSWCRIAKREGKNPLLITRFVTINRTTQVFMPLLSRR